MATGLAEAHIAAYQAKVHGQRLAHITKDGVGLRRSGVVSGSRRKQLILFAVVFKGKTRLRRARWALISSSSATTSSFSAAFVARRVSRHHQLVQGAFSLPPCRRSG